jgi:hypothetical protein
MDITVKVMIDKISSTYLYTCMVDGNGHLFFFSTIGMKKSDIEHLGQ